MHWDQVIGQENIVALLQRAVSSDRVAHAYLFHGPDGVGKRSVALALSRVLQCSGCTTETTCRPCSKILRLVHPDVQILLPQPSDAEPEDVAERLKLMAKDAYQDVDFVRAPAIVRTGSASSSKQAFYAVERIAGTLGHTMNLSPREGTYRIAIITDCETMRVQAANAFLKLLEEPGSQTVFVLTTSRLDLVLPTIQSRCQRIAFPPLSSKDIATELARRDGVATERANTAASMANGSFTRARALAQDEDLGRDRALVLDILRFAFTGNIERQAEIVETLAREGREQVKNLLSLMLSWIRDLGLYRVLGAEAPIVNIDQRSSVERFCRNVPDADLEAMASLVEEARRMIEGNVHQRVLLITLTQALGKAMHGPHEGRLYVPLTTAA